MATLHRDADRNSDGGISAVERLTKFESEGFDKVRTLTQCLKQSFIFHRHSEGNNGTWENIHQIRKLHMTSKPPFKVDLRDVFRITIGRHHAINVVPAKTSASLKRKRGIVARVTDKDDQVYSVAFNEAAESMFTAP